MNINLSAVIVLSLLFSMSTIAPAAPTTSSAAINAQPFDLSDVSLLPGPFLDARNQDITYLMELDPDRLLSGFLETAGLKPKAPKYGGWESKGVAGQALGHYMTALSYCYRSTGDKRCHDRLAYIVDELARCQAANKNGYSAAIPEGKKTFQLLKDGKVTATQGDLNGSWAPWYVIHKEMSGLRDAWQLAGISKARPVLIALADWTYDTTNGLSEDQLEKMMQCEFGGMNEVLWDVYAATGNPKYKAAADRFYHNAVLDPLERHQDVLDGLHANTQIPKIIGEARRYEITGDPKDRSIAEFFWNSVVQHHTYAMGGNSEYEHFGAPDHIAEHIGPTDAETCNTYNMLKLTLHLFQWKPQARYFDFYERALFNHIRASQEPGHPGAFTYYVSLKPGLFRTFSTPFDTFWCCVDTGMENHLRYTQGIYFHTQEALFVNLFIPSRVNWKEKGILLTQKTTFPFSDSISMDIKTSQPVTASIKIRIPSWAQSGISASVNGTSVPLRKSADGYGELSRQWKTGDQVKITTPMNLRTEPTPDNPAMIAIMYGPIELAASMGRNGIAPPAPYTTNATAFMTSSTPEAPVIVGANGPIETWIKPIDLSHLKFKTTGDVGRPTDFDLVPFYSLYRDRYAVYLEKLTPDQWKHRQANAAEQTKQAKILNARTIDLVTPGDSEIEKAHGLQSEKSRTGDFKVFHWRDALPEGSFSYTMKLDPSTSNALECTYWGTDKGNRKFHIFADHHLLATPDLDGTHPGEFVTGHYEIPSDLAKNRKTKLTFKGVEGNMAGGVFEVRIVKDDPATTRGQLFQNVHFNSLEK